MIALTILTTALLAVGQMIYGALGSASLSRAKGTAAITARSKMESLAALYHRNRFDPALSVGNHGPEQVEVRSPADDLTLNIYAVTWTIDLAPDRRPGETIMARLVTVSVEPIRSTGASNLKSGLNKAVILTNIFSPSLE